MALTPRAMQTAMEHRDMEPHVEWIDSETVHFLVSGFKREELRVHVTSSGKLKISGERRIDGGRVSKFEKELRIPDDCDVSGITAKYESEILQLRLPKSSSAHVADPKHSHETHQPQPLPQLTGKISNEPQPLLPNDTSSQGQHFQDLHTALPDDKITHEPNFQVPKPQMHDGTSSHEQKFHDPRTKLPADKTSHEAHFQVPRLHLPDDIISHQQHVLLPGTHLPDKHRPEPTTAKHGLAKRVHDAEATGSESIGRDRKFGELGAGRLVIEPESRKFKLTVSLVVVGALVVGYLSGRLDQAVRDGWTIVQSRP